MQICDNCGSVLEHPLLYAYIIIINGWFPTKSDGTCPRMYTDWEDACNFLHTNAAGDEVYTIQRVYFRANNDYWMTVARQNRIFPKHQKDYRR
jgi:uncharacterized protein YozE (UPF0346 family)